MNIESAETVLLEVTSKVEQQLPSVDIDNVRDYVGAGEWGIGYELLCTQLDEFEVQVDAGVFAALDELGEFGGFEPSVWENLRPKS